ncbi:SDR family NAD(P)-dependent oxidoreductase [Parapedobacter koreensis]|uniref:Short-chain dehydrogenase n=1 Tax=Parapedobacter koreensis TaxID=332977 RepID=A0A1H7RP23_9SPHI|nr:SDR family NAD(P)-dependent oxidoreductase [Parapedobacter koreensis]SEL61981.1 Short-chain dehydrogenase [Parapedobacter koreensis]
MATIVITGASGGIGFETALSLATAGHRIIAIARSQSGLHKLAEATRHHAQSTIHTLLFDIGQGDYEHVLLPFVRAQLGQVDILINNAGALINRPFEETPIDAFSDMFQSNFLGHVRMIQHVLPFMHPGSHIVNIGSMGGFQGSVKFPGLAAYSASKAALHALTECLALELTDKAIKINCLALGSAQTEMLRKAFPQYESPVTASEMGEYIAHFALTGHRLFNGKVLPVAVTTP